MKWQDLADVVNELNVDEIKVLSQKTGTYHTAADILSYFKTNAAGEPTTPRQRGRMCMELMRKHLAAIHNGLLDETVNPSGARSDANDSLWMRVVDARNYLMFILANLREA